MANKRHKPAEQLQGRGSRFKGESTLILVPPDAEKPIPAFPVDLDPKYKPVWEAYWGDGIAKLVTTADHYDIGRFFWLLSQRDTLQREALENPIALGSMDQEVPNPKFRIVDRLNREIEKYREQLGILPLARMRLGVAAGQAKEATVRGLQAELDAATSSVETPRRRVYGAKGT